MRQLWHHIAESNWINFAIVGAVVFYAWMYVQNLKQANELKDAVIAEQTRQIKSAKLQIEVDREAAAVVYADVYERLANMSSSKKVAEEKWHGVRKVSY
jgi:hypothetical protein